MRGLSFTEASTVRQSQSHVYEADFSSDYSYGTNIHGGYVASVIQRAVVAHATSTLAKYKQPHILGLQLQYLQPVSVGNGVVRIQDTRPAPGTSTLHVAVVQNGKEKVVGYVTCTNMVPGRGVSFDTKFQLQPPPPPMDLEAFGKGLEQRWIGYANPYKPKSFTKVQTHLQYVMPAAGTVDNSIMDQWITPTNPAVKFTTDMLGFVADQSPPLVENYRPGSIHSNEGIVARAQRVRDGTSTKEDEGWHSPFWYPTLSMGVEIKRQLPPEGVEWLFVRAQAKQIKDGRMDMEVLIYDADMQLVALAHHVCLIINAAWNFPKTKNKKDNGSEKL